MMSRVPEPELMDGAAQAAEYAETDFSASDAAFVERFATIFGPDFSGRMVDLGCGPGNIALRMAAAFPKAGVTGVDGADAMLAIARERAAALPEGSGRVEFIQRMLPYTPEGRYDAIVSNSLLHHLHDPSGMWRMVHDLAKPGAAIFFADLRRPESAEAAGKIVQTYVGDAGEVMRQDYFNSLLAAFTVEEVRAQLNAAGLHGLEVREVADRYLEVAGRYSGE